MSGSVGECMDECDKKSTCIAFAYYRAGSFCNLKEESHCNVHTILAPNPGRDTYFKTGVLAGTANAALAIPAVTVSAVGDPHMVNSKGQHFDIYRPGLHALLQIPKGAPPRSTLLRVEALAAQLGAACGDIYFTAVNISGRWVDDHRGLHVGIGA